MILVYTFYSFLVMACSMVFSSCTNQEQESNKEKPKFVIVNVLDKEAFDDCHIKGSINVPFIELKDFALKNWDKETTEIVLHCSNYLCTASGDGYRMLTNLGFEHVWAFEGGTAEAKQYGIPVVGPCVESYLLRYEKPEMYNEKKSVKVISVEDLKKKIEEFAIN